MILQRTFQTNAKEVAPAQEFKAVCCALLQLSVNYGVILSGTWLLGSRSVSALWHISDIRRHTPGPTLRAVSTT